MLCVVACEEIRNGNCPQGGWTTRGYKNLKEKFFLRAKMRHSTKQALLEMFYLVDSGYPNRPGYLAPYKGITYHFQEYNEGIMPQNRKEYFNYCHSSCRNVIERSFGVLKNKWRILFHLPSYPQQKQSMIICACLALHNFIRDSKLADCEFDMCDQDENYVPLPEQSPQSNDPTSSLDSQVMNQFRDTVANGLWSLKNM